jgi:acyl carrier protein phosphodiesterase
MNYLVHFFLAGDDEEWRWREHHHRPLSVYSQDVYRTLRGNLHRMPAAVHPLIDAMSHGDWLRAYASQRGIERALHGMAERRPVAAEIGTAGRLVSLSAIDLLRSLSSILSIIGSKT